MRVLIKRCMRFLVFRVSVAKIIIKPILKLHTLTYRYSGVFAGILNKGVHPKHAILGYKEWFVGHIKPNWVVLDVGCSSGIMTHFIGERVNFIYGLEINKCRLTEAESVHRENTEFICADATIYDYSNLRAIDVITLSNVLEHTDHRVDFLRKLLNQVKWNNEKRLLIRVPMIDRDWISVYKKQVGLEYRLDLEHFVEYTYDQFKEELSASNIEILEYRVRFGEIYAVCKGID
jgi:2-polyprenyl-3-methyl-5-hydroxy-6-metoxy-1,4-benzoquinol methylase